ncbi:MAG: glycoside hydrolase family 9 protein [Oscillospiraceae bacterium]|nr:glycoside hydrolase family 9 protein [Oscillospiraceae bacterium]
MKFKKTAALLLSAVISCSMLPYTAFAETTPNQEDYAPVDTNWAKLLQYSMYFYDANMCGTDVKENNLLPWRGDCHVYDAKVPLQPMDEEENGTNLSADFIKKYQKILDPDGDGYVDVSGGFHDAGDHVKFGLPEAYAASIVSWGYYEFRDAYEQTGQAEHAETICRYFCDYFMRSTFRDENGDVIAFCYQVGDGSIDHSYWQAPEIDAMARPAYFATEALPTTDDVSEAAAALAVNYLNFKDTDKKYAETCLDYAKALFNFAAENEKKVGQGADGPESFYTSSKWEDDFSFAACWLYLITENHWYLEQCIQYVDYYAPPGYVLCWNDMWNGVSILLGKIQDSYPAVCEEYRTAAGRNPYEKIDFWYMEAKAVNAFITGEAGMITPAGYFWLNEWGSARYNTAAQFCALVYDKYQNGKDLYEESHPDYYFSDWALGQMEYLLGDNPISRCYVVGYSENSAKYPHHRAASGLTMAEDTAEHKHVLWGALVGGPTSEDKHNDVTADWVDNEVTIDYNAAFVGAAAGLYARYGTPDMKPEENFPPPEKEDDSALFSGNDFWVSGYCSDSPEDTGAGVTKLTLFVNTDSLEAHTDISVRYYFSIKEFENHTDIPSSFVLQKTYDQVQTEVSGKEAVLSKPIHYKDDIYYIEISWPDYAIANSNKKYQFILGMYYGDNWDSSNDWSRQGIRDDIEDYDNIVGGVELAEKCPNICVYADGVLVGGTEPDGTVPEKNYTVAHLIRLYQLLHGKRPFDSKETAALFDFTGDGNINIYDAVMLKKILLAQ